MRDETRERLNTELSHAARRIAKMEGRVLARKVRLREDLKNDLEVREENSLILIRVPEDSSQTSVSRLLKFVAHGVRYAEEVDFPEGGEEAESSA